jgi:hypothetical protein
VEWSVNGHSIKPSNTYSGLFVVQLGFDQIIVKATDDNPGADISARVTCRGAAECGPTNVSFVVGTPSHAEEIKAGNIVLIVMLPFIVVVGIALLPVLIVAFVIDRATDSNTSQQVRRVGSELKRLLPAGPWKDPGSRNPQ